MAAEAKLTLAGGGSRTQSGCSCGTLLLALLATLFTGYLQLAVTRRPNRLLAAGEFMGMSRKLLIF